ncbi:MAG: EthD domain-containing protein [Myxococcota bacterium]
MVKLSFALRRLPHLTHAEFSTYWFETHGPLVQSHAKALRIHRYVQTHGLEHPINEGFRAGRGGPEPYDGVAELWWTSLDDLGAATQTPEGQAAGQALLEDEKRFIDLANSPLWIGEERLLVDGGEPSGG